MNRIGGKLVLVTGASSGIGEACARRFAAEGASLVLWARRERVRQIADAISAEYGVSVRAQAIDVRDRTAVFAAVDALAADNAVPDVLINNAGLARGMAPIHEGDPNDWDEMVDTNLKGLLNVSRAVIPHMVRLERGHIINIGSTAAHLQYPNGNVYAATKAAVRSLSDGMNLDLVGTPVRVTCVDPGFVETEFSIVRFHGDTERASSVYRGFRPLTGDDVADTVAYIANLPEHMNILDVVVVPTAQRNVYVVNRKVD